MGLLHECDTAYFDRTICPEPCGMMHSYCATCGKRQDACAHDALPANPETNPERIDNGCMIYRRSS